MLALAACTSIRPQGSSKEVPADQEQRDSRQDREAHQRWLQTFHHDPGRHVHHQQDRNDKGEEPLDGSLLVANYGKGKYVYTSLSFFRELPAGVPGAFRLFVNLISENE